MKYVSEGEKKPETSCGWFGCSVNNRKFWGNFEGKENLKLKGQMVRNMDIFINLCIAFPQLNKFLRVSECTAKAKLGLKLSCRI